MEVKCPQCSSRFNLPDSAMKPGMRLRCSVCSSIFTLPVDAAAQGESGRGRSAAKLPRAAGRSMSKIIVSLVLLLALAGGLYWYFVLRDVLPVQEETAVDLAKKVELLTMRNVRQYMVENEKTGKVFVIEGRVVNEFPEPKALIAVQAAIYDKDKKVLSEKKQWAGTQLSLFQLQVLDQKEMESFLGNKVEILTNNTNVKQGGEVPFMVLFYDPPADVAEFGVKIVDVQDAEPQE